MSLVVLTSSAVKAAGLLHSRVEAVGLIILRRARLVSGTTSISASLATTTTDRLIRLVSGSRATSEAETFNGALDQLVRLRRGGSVAGTSQKSNGGKSSEKHLDDKV